MAESGCLFLRLKLLEDFIAVMLDQILFPLLSVLPVFRMRRADVRSNSNVCTVYFELTKTQPRINPATAPSFRTAQSAYQRPARVSVRMGMRTYGSYYSGNVPFSIFWDHGHCFENSLIQHVT